MTPDRTSLSESTTQIIGSAPTTYEDSRYWIGNREVSLEEWNDFHCQSQIADPVIAELRKIRKQLTDMTSLLDQIKRKV